MSTVVACSTPFGSSGIAIVRISGQETKSIIKSLTGKEIPEARIATLRKINNINTSELIDEGIDIFALPDLPKDN